MADDLHRRVHGALVFDRRRDRLTAALSEQLPLDVSVLDIGCGNGEVGALLAEEGRHVRGVETLERDTCAIDMSVYDGETLPFDDDEFDWATIVDVLHHAADPARVLAEARRVTRSGIVVKDHFAQNTRHRTTLAVMDWVGNRQYGVGRDGEYLSRAAWRDVFDAVGLRVTAQNEQLDLYPAAVKPIFETGLHFVVRLESIDA